MEAFAALSLAIRAMTGMVEDLVPEQEKMKAAAGEGYATATDLADWLVRTLKMPFRDAHHVTGRIVGLASKQGVALHELPLKAMQEVEPKISADALRVLSVESSVKSRTSYGGTAPKNVEKQARAWLKRLEKERKLG
jgi:argininosuccinate lyase